jgi:hypothetical protein
VRRALRKLRSRAAELVNKNWDKAGDLRLPDTCDATAGFTDPSTADCKVLATWLGRIIRQQWGVTGELPPHLHGLVMCQATAAAWAAVARLGDVPTQPVREGGAGAGNLPMPSTMAKTAPKPMTKLLGLAAAANNGDVLTALAEVRWRGLCAFLLLLLPQHRPAPALPPPPRGAATCSGVRPTSCPS